MTLPLGSVTKYTVEPAGPPPEEAELAVASRPTSPKYSDDCYVVIHNKSSGQQPQLSFEADCRGISRRIFFKVRDICSEYIFSMFFYIKNRQVGDCFIISDLIFSGSSGFVAVNGRQMPLKVIFSFERSLA